MFSPEADTKERLGKNGGGEHITEVGMTKRRGFSTKVLALLYSTLIGLYDIIIIINSEDSYYCGNTSVIRCQSRFAFSFGRLPLIVVGLTVVGLLDMSSSSYCGGGNCGVVWHWG